METEEIVDMSVSEYCDLLISTAEFNGHNDPHKTNYDWCFWNGVVSEEKYHEVTQKLAQRGYPGW